MSAEAEEILLSLKKAGSDLELRNAKGETALLLAGKSLNLAGVKILISQGAQINAVDFRGESVLFKFARKGQKEAVKELISLGVDPSLKNQEGQTALDL